MRRTKKDMLKNTSGILKSRKIANNTIEYSTENGRFIRLHDTDIISFIKDKMILNSGGWRTPTTKDRINLYLPSGIVLRQQDSKWYLANRASWKNLSLFYDGITIKNGVILRPTNPLDTKKIDKLLKLISEYCKKLKTLDKLPEPSGADCWYCHLRDKDGKTLGDISGNEHLMEHLKEKYIHGSLIFNALTWAGYRNPGFVMDMRECIVRAVRRYLKRQLQIS